MTFFLASKPVATLKCPANPTLTGQQCLIEVHLNSNNNKNHKEIMTYKKNEELFPSQTKYLKQIY
jgi:hypothetical protein